MPPSYATQKVFGQAGSCGDDNNRQRRTTASNVLARLPAQRMTTSRRVVQRPRKLSLLPRRLSMTTDCLVVQRSQTLSPGHGPSPPRCRLPGVAHDVEPWESGAVRFRYAPPHAAVEIPAGEALGWATPWACANLRCWLLGVAHGVEPCGSGLPEFPHAPWYGAMGNPAAEVPVWGTPCWCRNPRCPLPAVAHGMQPWESPLPEFSYAPRHGRVGIPGAGVPVWAMAWPRVDLCRPGSGMAHRMQPRESSPVWVRCGSWREPAAIHPSHAIHPSQPGEPPPAHPRASPMSAF